MSEEPQASDQTDNDQVERDVHEALKSLGWATPDNEDDVTRLEAEISQGTVELPETLKDTGRVFQARPQEDPTTIELPHFSADVETQDSLARAARAGKPIPPEIEEIMRRDRQAAQREVNDGPANHDNQKNS